MRINFLCNHVFDGWEPTDKRLGGTEESIIRWAEELRKRGHLVGVFRNGRGGLHHYNGVDYWERDKFMNMDDGIGTVCVNIKSSDIAPEIPTLYLTNEVDADKLDLSAYDGVIWPSHWARDNIPVNNPKTFILPHGYDDTKIFPGNKIPKQCLYASSPDRGLDTLLRAWPKVYAEHPDATLIVTYGAQEYDIPGVTFLEATEDEMNELYNTSDFWCHPCSGGELFGITGIKAQAAGCVPVIIPTMALQETVRHGIYATKDTYTDTLCRALRNEDGEADRIRQLLATEKYDNWETSTGRLEEIISSII